MNGETPTLIERFNQAVRSIVTLGLTTGFLYGFWADKISGEVFTSVFAGVIGYWFASRDARSRAADIPTVVTKTATGETTVAPSKPAGG